jgi:phenylalanyl-tRNA synthetase beta chain
MQFSENWLRTWVDPKLSTSELAELLTMSGLEIEHCVPVAPAFSGVVVAQVLSLERHPNAQKLNVCEVDVGEGTRLSIVCGAPNVAAGMKVPCARVGARLPGQNSESPLEIRSATLRGVDSQGMLCSAKELGLSEDAGGLLALAADAPVGSDLREFLVLDDRLFTVKLTPNRADCLSVLGIAREVSALTGTALTVPPIKKTQPSIADKFPVSISAPQGCGRFTGRVILGVRADAPTPEWMKQRLERAGQRSISALVDVTNYVMLELGRPLHVYDLDKLRGGIEVRFGAKGENLKLLNEQTVPLDEDVLVIADEGGPIGLAGIMGGDRTKADLATRNVFLEAAFFFPDAIAGRARRYNFSSDASHRFERGVDFDNNLDGIERATELILTICGGRAGPVVDTVAGLPVRKPVRMRRARAEKILGVAVSAEDISAIFTRLGLNFAREVSGKSDTFVVTPPAFRFDIEIEEDLIEEVARVYGYERIPVRPPTGPQKMLAQPEELLSTHELRNRWAAAGYHEVVNYSFVDSAWETDLGGNSVPIRLVNPIAGNLDVMRTGLMGGLIANVRYNLNRKLDRIRIFEIGRAFLRDTTAADGELSVAGIRQPVRCAAAAYGLVEEEQWGTAKRMCDFYDLKGDLQALLAPRTLKFESCAHPALHPGRSASVVLDGRQIGWIGELHPKWRRKYEIEGTLVLCELDCEPIQCLALPHYAVVSKFPPVRRDISVTLDETIKVQVVIESLLASANPIVDTVTVFDVYRGKGIENGKKGLAFRVLLKDTQKTLTDGEVEAALDDLRDILAREFGASLRQ